MFEKRIHEFSSESADYYFHYGIHIKKTVFDKINTLDAIVLESGFNAYDQLTITSMLGFPQYSELFANNLIIDNPKPIFFVDMPTSPSLRKLGHLGYALDLSVTTVLSILPCLFYNSIPPYSYLLLSPVVSNVAPVFSGINSTYNSIINYTTLLDFYTSYGYRSALSAKKIEEFIVPEVRARNNGKRPTIFIDYGAGHADMVPYIKYKSLRDKVIVLHEKLPMVLLDHSYTDKVSELRVVGTTEPCMLEKILSREDEPISLSCTMTNTKSNSKLEKEIFFERITYQL